MIETSGADDQVVKFLCPLTISRENLKRGIDIVEQAIAEVCASEGEIPEVVDFFEDDYSVSDDDRFRKAS
jgi:diaminobutyrate-2-oxoglutarate transaminase